MLCQIDGSHSLVGGAGAQAGAAPGRGRCHRRRGPSGLSRSGEDTRGYLVLLEGLVRQWGIPLALYSDRHAAFKYNARQAPVLAESTQFARVMRELGIRQIYALSPQAKGRVERMGPAGHRIAPGRCCHHPGGQRCPPAVPAQVQRPVRRGRGAARESLPPGIPELSLTETICLKHPRKVGRDNTVKYHWRPATASRDGPA